MLVEILIPRLGTVKSDATLVEWTAGEGGRVEQGSVVLSIETQKIQFDIEAEASGFLHILVGAGTTCPVGTVAGLLAASIEELATLQKERPPVSKLSTTTGSIGAAAPAIKIEQKGEIRISPVARKMAKEHSIDITMITGTGPEGRIVREDIEKFLASTSAAPAEQPRTGKAVKHSAPFKGMRAVIADRLRRSLAESVQLSAMGEIDMTEAMRLRTDFLSREQELGTRITYNDLLIYIVAKALRENLTVNSSIVEREITVWDDINIGVAVAVEKGLIVSVIRNADRRPLPEISIFSNSIVERARAGTLMPDDVSGGTFTITNLGAAGAGYRFETAVINPPESAILGIGGITDRAVVRNGQIVVRPIMTYSFTYDHRVIDGAVAVQFMARVIEQVENPGPLFLLGRELVQ